LAGNDCGISKHEGWISHCSSKRFELQLKYYAVTGNFCKQRKAFGTALSMLGILSMKWFLALKLPVFTKGYILLILIFYDF